MQKVKSLQNLLAPIPQNFCIQLFQPLITGPTGSVKIGDLGLATLKNKSFAKSVIGKCFSLIDKCVFSIH
jgi:hypothetical protein